MPANFRCPISLELMKDPVKAPTGINNGRERWLVRGRDTCPITGGPVWLADLVPNNATRHMIQDWCVANQAERVPTPKVPVAEADAAEHPPDDNRMPLLLGSAVAGAHERSGPAHRGAHLVGEELPRHAARQHGVRAHRGRRGERLLVRVHHRCPLRRRSQRAGLWQESQGV